MTTLWTRENLCWLAGLMEGEACFGVRTNTVDGKRYPYIRVCMNMNDEDVVRKAARIAGCGQVYGPKKRKSGNPFWSWNITRSEYAFALSMAVFPFLGERRQAKIRELVKVFRTLRHNERKTHCPAGHPYEGDNLIVWRGGRFCRACKDASR